MTRKDSKSKDTAPLQRRWPEAVSLFFVLLVVGGIITLAYRLGIVLCPLKRYTGVPCPTCGSTRALVLALRGDFVGAFDFQPLVMTLAVLAGPVTLAAWLSSGVRRFLRSVCRHPLAWVLAGLALAANWVYVIVHGN